MFHFGSNANINESSQHFDQLFHGSGLGRHLRLPAGGRKTAIRFFDFEQELLHRGEA
jgi:hypothetical protein